ncbi:MAG: PspC domain-containing protein [Acidimicrobiia bacterium]|nr:PspC domain-containing protein [Acidimicrobiia bacterium]
MKNTEQTEHQSQTPPRPRLERLRSDRAVAGVASGLARYLGVDVAWIRIGFVVLALFGGSGILLYLIGWLAIPEEGEHESIAADKAGDLRGVSSWVGIGLIAIAGMIVLGNTGVIRGELIFAAALVAAGVLLYRGDIGRSAKPQGEEPPPVQFASTTPPAAEVEAVVPTSSALVEDEPQIEDTGWEDEPSWKDSSWRSDEPSYPVTPPPPPPPPDPAFQPRPRVPKETSVLGRFALATALIVVGIMGVGHSAGWFELTLRHYAAAILVVFGGALLISSFFGRARWLIVVGLIMAPLLIAMALLKVPFEGGFGDVRHVPTNAAEVNNEYRLIAGQMILDLTDLELADDEVVTLEASVVFGRLEVKLPPGLGVDAVAKVDAGEMFLDGQRGSRLGQPDSDNINVQRNRVYEGTGLVELEAHVGFGELVIDQVVDVVEEVTP